MTRGLVISAVLAGAITSMFGPLLASAESPAAPQAQVNTGRPAGGAFIETFKRGHDQSTHVLANWDAETQWMVTSFRRENVAYGPYGMRLTARANRDQLEGYTSGEFQRAGFYGYGRYEVIMRPSNAPGMISSFFVYTGEDMGDPHDEIDFEFLGRSPRQVHLNYYTHDATSPADADLNFDASASDHLYAFEWSPNAIIWYVDGREVHRAVRGYGVPIPTTTGRIMASVWAGNRVVAEWSGTPTVDSASAVYRCISHVPIGKSGRQCSDSFKPSAPKR